MGQNDTRWHTLAQQHPLSLAEAYELSLKERENLVRQAGLPLVQDLHLLDAEPALNDADADEEQTHTSGNATGFQPASEQTPPRDDDNDIKKNRPKKTANALS